MCVKVTAPSSATLSICQLLIDLLWVSAVWLVPWIVVCTVARCTTSVRMTSPGENLYLRSKVRVSAGGAGGAGGVSSSHQASGAPATDRDQSDKRPTESSSYSHPFESFQRAAPDSGLAQSTVRFSMFNRPPQPSFSRSVR